MRSSGADDGSVGAPPAAGRYRAGAARSLRSLHRQPAPRGLGFACVQVMVTPGSPARPRIGPLCNGCSPTSRRVAHPRHRRRSHHRRCGTGIWPDRDITAFRPDIPAPACLCRPRPLVPARTTAENRGFSTSKGEFPRETGSHPTLRRRRQSRANPSLNEASPDSGDSGAITDGFGWAKTPFQA